MLATPVLFLIFNRPENTREVFETIKKAKPKQLFIAADGPRGGVEGEADKCAAARRIATQVDWECEMKTLFRESNLGCKMAVSSGIDWFFQNVEEGIILEDDCKPDITFFTFCDKLLAHYRTDTRIMMISGTNYLPDNVAGTTEDSYFFSNYYPIWGWATWRRAWRLYDVEMRTWDKFKEKKQLYWLFSYAAIARYYETMFDMLRNGFNTWDIQWWFTCIFQNGLAIIPRTNLITNIGIEGTHSNTQGDFFINKATVPVSTGNLKHPFFVFPDKHLNEMTYLMSHAQINVEEVEPRAFSNEQLERIVDVAPGSFLMRSLIRRVRKRLRLRMNS